MAAGMTTPQASRDAMITALQSVNGNDGLMVVILVTMMGYLSGSLLVLIGLVRARLLSVVPLALVVIAIAFDFIPAGDAGESIKIALGSLGFLWMGIALFRFRAPAQSGQSELTAQAQQGAALGKI
jgi:hypothetical protein